MSLNWGAELARLTVFSGNAATVSEKDWQAITGQEEAETRQIIAGGRRLSGKVSNGLLHVSASGQRIDIVNVRADDEPAQNALPVLGSYEEVFGAFFEFTKQWLQELPLPVVRLAFGAVLLCETQSRDRAYEELATLISSLKVDPDRMRDFQYRVNWPGESHVVKGLLLNRLTTWSALRLVQQHVEVSGEGLRASELDTVVYGVRLEVDNNTDPAWKAPFDRESLIPIYLELLDLARDNAVKGEVL
jgi:hypothetical protein